MEEERRRLQGMSSGEREEASRHRSKQIKDDFLTYNTHMAKSISDWVEHFKKIPAELMEEECFRVGSQIGKKLLGMEDEKVQPDEEIVATLTQAKEDEEELSPQWIAEMEVMMQAYDKTNP